MPKKIDTPEDEKMMLEAMAKWEPREGKLFVCRATVIHLYGATIQLLERLEYLDSSTEESRRIISLAKKCIQFAEYKLDKEHRYLKEPV